MTEAIAHGVVRFVDRRFEHAIDTPLSGAVEVIYELDDEPDSLRSLVVPRNRLPPGLAKGAVITVTTDADGERAVALR